MTNKWECVARDNDTADGILHAILRQRNYDIRANIKRQAYIIREFQNSVHPEVGTIPNSFYAISTVTVDKIVEQLKEKNTSNFNAVCSHINRKIGLPFIPRPIIPKNCQRRIRSPEEIRLKLDKAERRVRRETKDLATLCGDGIPPISSRVTGSYNALRWIFNSGNIRAWDAILQRLHETKIEQERDRLFHVRRHENDYNMNNCFDEEINGAIAEFNWALIDNPFSSISMPGMSFIGLPSQNETPIEHDE